MPKRTLVNSCRVVASCASNVSVITALKAGQVIVTATYNGATETLTNSSLSVKSYIDTVRAQNADNAELIALLDALLVYGANAQVYMGHNTDSLVAELGELAVRIELDEAAKTLKIVDNGIDEVINGYGNYIKIIIHYSGSNT